MNLRKKIQTLDYRDIDLSDDAIEGKEPNKRGELYLLRAQLKALTADGSLLGDCFKARELLKKGKTVECAYSFMRLANPGSLSLIPKQRGMYAEYLKALFEAQEIFFEYSGDCGKNILTLVRSEALYYTHEYEEAASLAFPLVQEFISQDKIECAMFASYVLLRCYLAAAKPDNARKVVFDLFEWSKKGKDFYRLYGIMRSWLNLTTGWSGDSLRYHTVPDGTVIPVLEDRAAAIKQGIGEYTDYEFFVLNLSEKFNKSAMTMPDFYLMIYKIMVEFNSCARPIAELNLPEVFNIVYDTGLIQPLIEYGEQIIPLLKAAAKEGLFDREWLHLLTRRAQSYERSLKLFRSDG